MFYDAAAQSLENKWGLRCTDVTVVHGQRRVNANSKLQSQKTDGSRSQGCLPGERIFESSWIPQVL